MRRHQERDQARFERVYTETYAAVCGYVLRRTSDPADAADAVAETYLTLWRRFGELGEEADPRLWLFGVARRVLANQRRSVGRLNALTLRLTNDFVLLRAAAVAETEPAPDRARIAAAFRRLSESDRELLALVGWEGLDRDQIAETLGVSKGVVRLRLHRARQRFDHELGKVGLERDGLDKDSTGRGSPQVRLEPALTPDRKKASS